MDFTLECEQEADGRWIAEVPELPGVLSNGDSASDAMSKAEILALRVIPTDLKTATPSLGSVRICCWRMGFYSSCRTHWHYFWCRYSISDAINDRYGRIHRKASRPVSQGG